MAIRTTGAEYKRFIRDDWDGAIYDDEYVEIGGEEFDGNIDDIKDEDIVYIEGGDVYNNEDMDEYVCSYETFFKRWRRKQNYKIMLVEVPKEFVDEFEQYCKAHKARVIRR